MQKILGLSICHSTAPVQTKICQLLAGLAWNDHGTQGVNPKYFDILSFHKVAIFFNFSSSNIIWLKFYFSNAFMIKYLQN